MFFHDQHLQYNAQPDRPDPIYAMKLQEALGGQWGEMSVMLQYLFQGWNCRGPQKYRDMLLGIGTEEIAHVEMLATMIGRLLETAPTKLQDEAAQNPLVEAAMGGNDMTQAIISAAMNPQHFIVNGLGAAPNDSVGFPWTARFITSSGNLLADFRLNLTAESQGRLHVARLYELTDDAGVRDMLSFMLARDTMHQNQWIAAIADLEREGLETTPVPSSFPLENERRDVAYQFWNCSNGAEASAGSWASGPTPDGKGEFEFLENPSPLGPIPVPPKSLSSVHGTASQPQPPSVDQRIELL